jgi:hypothetical protein
MNLGEEELKYSIGMINSQYQWNLCGDELIAEDSGPVEDD